MALTKGFGLTTATTPNDARLMAAERYTRNADGTVRTGVLGSGADIVTAGAGLNYSLARADFVTSPSLAAGAYEFTNDGTINVLGTAGPTANSRRDILWVNHNDAGPTVGITAGAASATPAKPAIPTGAIEVADILVPANMSAATGAVITNSHRITSLRGARVIFRTDAEALAYTGGEDGQRGISLATGHPFVRVGGSWVMARLTASGRVSNPDVTAGTAQNVLVNFPPGLFTDATAIRVFATPSNARLSAGVDRGFVTLASARISVANWSPAVSGAGFVDWIAFQGDA